MPFKLSKALKDKPSPTGVASTLREYEQRFRSHKGEASETRESGYRKVTETLL